MTGNNNHMNDLHENENLLRASLSMDDSEASAFYYQIAQNWFHLQNQKAFRAFSSHIKRMLPMIQSTSKGGQTRLNIIRAFAFIASNRKLHHRLLDCDILRYMVYTLANSPEAANCEAALVVLTHVCTQSTKSTKNYKKVSLYFKDKQNLTTIFRYAHVEDSCPSILANVFSVLAALCTGRTAIQEQSIRAGIMERAYNLKNSRIISY